MQDGCCRCFAWFLLLLCSVRTFIYLWPQNTFDSQGTPRGFSWKAKTYIKSWAFRSCTVLCLISYRWMCFSKAFVFRLSGIISVNTQRHNDIPAVAASVAVCCSTSLSSKYFNLSTTTQPLFNINRKRKHTACILLSLKLMSCICHFSSAIVVITLVCKECSCLAVSQLCSRACW